jgi:hypothetical protein
MGRTRLLLGNAVTMTFKVGTQMLRVTRRLNMVIISVKNQTLNNKVMGRTRIRDVHTYGRSDIRTHKMVIM